MHDSELFIFSDGPNLKNSDDQQKVNSVREYIEDIKGFKSVSIYKNKENFGLEKSVTNGLNKISSEYEAFIILEDDLILSPYFLNFMNYALKTFQKDNNVWSINGMSANKNLLNLPENFLNRKMLIGSIERPHMDGVHGAIDGTLSNLKNMYC